MRLQPKLKLCAAIVYTESVWHQRRHWIKACKVWLDNAGVSPEAPFFCAKTCSSVRSWQRVECVAFFSSNETSKQSFYLGPCHLPKQFDFYIMMFTWHNNNTFRIIYNKRSAIINIAVSTRQLLSNFSDLEQLLILSSNFSNFVQLFWITFKAICN